MSVQFNLKPKVGDTFFIHKTEEEFDDPCDVAAHINLEDCADSARAWAGQDHRSYLVLECRVVRRFPGKD